MLGTHSMKICTGTGILFSARRADPVHRAATWILVPDHRLGLVTMPQSRGLHPGQFIPGQIWNIHIENGISLCGIIPGMRDYEFQFPGYTWGPWNFKVPGCDLDFCKATLGPYSLPKLPPLKIGKYLPCDYVTI